MRKFHESRSHFLWLHDPNRETFAIYTNLNGHEAKRLHEVVGGVMARVIPFAVPEGFKVITSVAGKDGAKIIEFRRPESKKSA